MAKRLTTSAAWILGPGLPYAFISAALAAYALAHYWVCDDAFISFRYARHFAAGDGLVYNLGERVEGYTNFAWVVELGLLHRLTGVELPHLATTLSALCTVGTLAVTVLFARSTPLRSQRSVVVLVAFGWLALQRSSALWATSGLETRQLTFLVVLGAWLVWSARGRSSRLAYASLVFGLASLTRPEGPLLWGGALAWYVTRHFPCARSMPRGRGLAPIKTADRWRPLLALGLPCGALVAGHFLWRHAYYGDWLPNTYYAKHLQAWPDAGVNYFVTVALEAGLYVVLPIALVGMLARRSRERQSDGLYGLFLWLVVPHALYVVRIGGDHFVFRPLDFYFPLIAVALGEGIGAVALSAHLAARRRGLRRPRNLGRAGAFCVAAPVLVYSTVIQLAEYTLHYEAPFEKDHVNSTLTPQSFPLVSLLPGGTELANTYNAAMRSLLKHAIAVRWREHERFSISQREKYGRYSDPHRRSLPPGIVMAYPYAGILPFQFPEVTFVDTLGLTDRTVARHRIEKPNRDRVMAHDRFPPPGYLEQRGVNVEILPAATSLPDALRAGPYAVQLAPHLWMPFKSAKFETIEKLFAGFDLYERPTFHAGRPAPFLHAGRRLTHERDLGTFDRDTSGWTLEGAFQRQTQSVKGQATVSGQIGSGRISSYRRGKRDEGSGTARSPSFTIETGDALAFFVAGGSRGVGVDLLIDGKPVRTWHGDDSERFRLIVEPLDAFTGRTARLSAYDRTDGAWGHLMLDQVMLLR